MLMCLSLISWLTKEARYVHVSLSSPVIPSHLVLWVALEMLSHGMLVRSQLETGTSVFEMTIVFCSIASSHKDQGRAQHIAKLLRQCIGVQRPAHDVIACSASKEDEDVEALENTVVHC
jgi:hypothetical protein